MLHDLNDAASWWRVAHNQPLEAIDSPLYPLLTLEDPARWLALEQRKAQDWMFIHASQQPDWWQLGFSAACLRRILPLFTALYPEDTVLDEAIALIERGYGPFGWASRGSVHAQALRTRLALQEVNAMRERHVGRKNTHAWAMASAAVQCLYLLKESSEILTHYQRTDDHRPAPLAVVVNQMLLHGFATEEEQTAERVQQWRMMVAQLRIQRRLRL